MIFVTWKLLIFNYMVEKEKKNVFWPIPFVQVVFIYLLIYLIIYNHINCWSTMLAVTN